MKYLSTLYYNFKSSNTLPDWITNIQQKALEQLEATKLPNRKHPNWKHTSLSFLKDEQFLLSNTQPTLTEDKISSLKKQGHINLVIMDGEFIKTYSDSLPQEVSIYPIAETPTDYIKEIEKTKDNRASNPDYTDHLNNLFFKKGFFFKLTKQSIVQKTIHLIHISTLQTKKKSLSFVKNSFYLDKASTLRLQESFYTFSQKDQDVQLKPAMTANSHHTDFFIKEQATLTYSYNQFGNTEKNYNLNTHHFFQEKGAFLKVLYVFSGTTLSRQNTCVFLQEEQAKATFNGLYLLKKKQHLDLCINVYHQAKHTTSSQFFKGLLADEAKGIFQGTLFVDKNASQTNANQLNKNLLLSETATSITQPQLQIDTDDVKCAHGATVSQIRQDEIFYLQSRGLSKSHAIQLLSLAFAKDILDQHYDNEADLHHLNHISTFIGATQ